MFRLIIKTSEAGLDVIELRSGTQRLGRNPDNEFPIDHPTVSGLHCEIVCLENKVVVRDCGSTNGTCIDGRPITESNLRPSQVLQLGEVRMVLELSFSTVAIPPLDFQEPTAPLPLEDGSIPCLNHPEARARRRCSQCEKSYCDSCVHTLRRVGGKVLRLCPACSGLCELIAWQEDAAPRKKTLLDRVRAFKQTLRLSRKKPKKNRRR